MKIQAAVLMLLITLLTGCLGQVWTAVNFIYDRHHFFKQMNDYTLMNNTQQMLAAHDDLKARGCRLEVVAFKGDLLLTGHVSSWAIRAELDKKIRAMGGFKHFYNQIEVKWDQENELIDSWITSSIRTRMLIDSDLDQRAFKVVTTNRIVYLLGNIEPAQGDKVIYIARSTQGVKRVVNLMHYYYYLK